MDGYGICFDLYAVMEGLLLSEDPGREEQEFFLGRSPEFFPAGEFHLDLLDWFRGEEAEILAVVRHEKKLHQRIARDEQPNCQWAGIKG